MIQEVIVTTRNADGSAHIAPMGVRESGGEVLIAPFRPSRTLDNLLREGCAAINCTDDVRVFAGCLTGRRDWPVVPTDRVAGLRLAGAIAHTEVSVERVEEDPVRPRLLCRARHHATHAPFRGFNRAQAAVLELAILVSRLDRLPAEKIDAELGYLAIAVEKTAGAREREAWEWLLAAVAAHRRREACA